MSDLGRVWQSKVQQLRGQPMEGVVHDAILSEILGLSQTAYVLSSS